MGNLPLIGRPRTNYYLQGMNTTHTQIVHNLSLRCIIFVFISMVGHLGFSLDHGILIFFFLIYVYTLCIKICKSYKIHVGAAHTCVRACAPPPTNTHTYFFLFWPNKCSNCINKNWYYVWTPHFGSYVSHSNGELDFLFEKLICWLKMTWSRHLFLFYFLKG